MKCLWLMLFGVGAILVEENFCVPAVRPLSQRGVIFPVDNWDNCYLDDASTRAGFCTKLDECPDVLKKWDNENVYPKTCYFIKKQQFVCCPTPASNTPTLVSEKPVNILLESQDASTTMSSNIFLDKVKNKPVVTTAEHLNILLNTTFTTQPSNIFLDNLKGKTTTSTNRPGNTVLDNLSTSANSLFDIFITEQPSFIKRRSEAECDIQNPQKFYSVAVPAKGPPSELNDFPFMAVLGWRSEIDKKVWYPCGGILISPKFVLTAAHCADIGGLSPALVHLGDKNLTESAEGTHKIKNFIIHPNYNETAIKNDIALVELEQEVSIPMACLWTQHDLPIAQFIALGYGHISFETISSNQLFKTLLTPVDNSECQEIYKFDAKLRDIRIVDNNFCAGDVVNFRHFCQGDTGGPLVVELQKVVYVVGITAFGLGCAELPPSIFTRVSSFIDWIEPIVWPEIDVRINNK